jgi:hypothetical protein
MATLLSVKACWSQNKKGMQQGLHLPRIDRVRLIRGSISALCRTERADLLHQLLQPPVLDVPLQDAGTLCTKQGFHWSRLEENPQQVALGSHTIAWWKCFSRAVFPANIVTTLTCLSTHVNSVHIPLFEPCMRGVATSVASLLLTDRSPPNPTGCEVVFPARLKP